jgi:hypothetical protein
MYIFHQAHVSFEYVYELCTKGASIRLDVGSCGHIYCVGQAKKNQPTILFATPLAPNTMAPVTIDR